MNFNYLNRLAEKKFLRMNNSFPVVLVTGPRQIGKTTMLEHLSIDQPRTYVTLDDLTARDLAINDPILFFQTYKPPILIDEIQYAPNLFSQIKLICDKNKIPGEFWLTGSQSYHVMKGVSESLAGRVGIIEMSGFTIDEYLSSPADFSSEFNIETLQARFRDCKKYSIDELFRFIYRGGMPKAFEYDDETHNEYLKTFISTYLMRDVMELGKVSDIVRFNRFLTACASMISDQINFATLATAADISQPTAKEWLNILQGLGVIYLVQPYYSNEIKRLVKSPKLYFYDTGLAACLSLWPSPETLQVSKMSGAYFENFVMNQIIKKLALSPKAPNLFYYRDTDQKEIDIILECYNGLIPLEIKLTSRPHNADVSKFSVLEKFSKPILNGGIICTIDQPALADAKHSLIPVWLL